MNASEIAAADEGVVRTLPTSEIGSPREVEPVPAGNTWTIELIDGRAFERECFKMSLRTSDPDLDVITFASVAAWCDAPRPGSGPAAVVLNVGSARVSAETVRKELAFVVERAQPTPVVVLAVSEQLGDLIEAVDAGARGYVPSSVGVGVMLEATRLAIAGGVFLPADSVLSMRKAVKEASDEIPGVSNLFTKRQAAVANALRRGTITKVIAYQLDMCESTVKVHIRTIMRKLNARNRTEAAYKLNQLFPSDAA